MKTEFSQFLNGKNSIIEQLCFRPKSLTSLLPYDEYLEDKQIFIMKDGSFGSILKLKLVEHEPKTEASILKVIKELESLYNLPENCTLQVLFDQSVVNQLSNEFKKIKGSFKDGNKFSNYLFDEKLKVLSQNNSYERMCLISIRYFPRGIEKSNNDSDKYLKSHFNSFIGKLRSFEKIVKSIIELEELSFTKITADDLLNYLRKFFNPKTFYKRSFAKFNKSASLSKQILYNSPNIGYDSIQRENLKTRTFSLKCSPAFSYPGGTSYFLKLNFPFTISLNFSFPSSKKTKFFFDTKEFFLQNAFTEKAKVQKEEVKDIQRKLARNDRCLYLTYTISVDGETEEELDEKERQIAQVFQKLDCEIIKEEEIGFGMLLNSLPLNYSPVSDMSAQRFIRIMRKDASRLLPVFTSFEGMNQSMLVYPSREHGVVPFSLLDNKSSSHHTVICADTGSGKSTLIADLIWSSKRLNPEAITFVIDKKSSYSMLCELYGGSLTIFDRKKEIPFSPFRGVYDEEKFAFLTKLFVIAINLTSPSYTIESDHYMIINKALKEAYKRKTAYHGLKYENGNLTKETDANPVKIDIDDFIFGLSSIESNSEHVQKICAELSSKLSPFYGDGIYSKFFKSSENTNNDSNLFYVYDLDGLTNDPILLPLMSLSVIEEIRSKLALPENSGRTGVLVLEEFAMLGRNNPIIKDFIIEFAETMRKRGCWLISATPRPRNFFELEQGRALFETADNYLFLNMSDDNVDYIASQSSLFDEANTQIIKSLKKSEKFSEIFYMNKKKSISGAFRNYLTPTGRWLSPNNAKDALTIQKAKEKYKNPIDLLNYLVEKDSQNKDLNE